MKIRILFAALALLIFSALQAQNPTPAPVIHLIGTSTLKVLPDLAVIDFNVRSKAKLENEALTKLNNSSNALLERLLALGFTRDQVRITNFYLTEDYIYTEGTPRKIGYVASQSLTLKFPYDKERLTQLFGKLAAERTEDVSLNFGTALSETLEKSSREQLIEKALQDARDKADLIARSSKLRLVSIQKIEYGAAEFSAYPPMMRQEGYVRAEAASAPNFGTINANEIMLAERISVTYLVENIR